MVQNKIIECLQKYGSCIYILASVYFVILNSQAVHGGDVQPDIPSLEATLNTDIYMQWKVRILKKQLISTFTLKILLEVEIFVIFGLPELQAVTKVGEKMFENRISGAYNDTAHVYTVTLKEIQYNDTLEFRLLTEFSSPEEIKGGNVVITKVTGSPETCGESVKPAYNINETVSLTVTQDICGHPKPYVEWKLEKDNTFSGSFSSVLISNASRKYRYSFQTREMIRSHCGKKIMYNARNEFGNVEENSTIYVSFKPSKITLTSSYRYKASCVYLTWYREDTGNCFLTYHLKFDDKDDVYSTLNTNFSLCHSSCAISASVWASYKGIAGYKTSITVVSIPSRPDTTTMPTDDCQYARKLAIGIVSTIVIGLILNIVIFVILKKKGFIVFTRNPRKPSQNTERRDDDNYEITEITSSHYAELNVNSVKPSIYADLTTDSSKEYAEIELNETKRNMYANINT